ncbi:uncharacterized protein Z519_09372 [Cladophialophora bantiana CBS 173.52]|uniref:Uncharacterized protein n=1 Tax=Cladophialophora bantiana (strain ATCC 10958 / CBS 173.52 / CDC B-1940 / NIH 8579) TaxID=1442370 RepID=A0A0D2FTS8_CLAB1|nr:uncharacterized protein Z519_09372 [Cladophialophora bantiana CBS 173.52]KIW89942.1 hypothetical protein Z519_09372 [Cladophialophora bantiana CBS 173.52]
MQHYLSSLLGALPLVASHGLNRLRIEDIGSAQNNWAHNTGIVSTFLFNAATFAGGNLAAQVQLSPNAKKTSSINHNAALDAVFLNVASPNALVVQANDVLFGEQMFNNVVISL